MSEKYIIGQIMMKLGRDAAEALEDGDLKAFFVVQTSRGAQHSPFQLLAHRLPCQ
jgi:hypothetical protein